MRRVVFPAVFAFAAAPAVASIPPDQPVEQMSDGIEVTHDPAEHHQSGHSLLIVPIPQSNPTLGTGLTLGAALFYNPNQSPEPWISGAGAMYTSNGSWAVGLFHKMALDHDRFRMLAFGGYGDVNIKFYGVGPEAGDRGRSIELNEQGLIGLLQGQMRLAPHVYLGGRLEYLGLDTSINRENPLFPDLEIPRQQFHSSLVGIGPVANYDRRDSSLNTHDGELISAAWMFNVPALGSDFSYNKFTLSGNVYRPLGPNTVIAAHAAICTVTRGAPFYDQCMYGAGNDLRGYATGRYRDRALWAMQFELRQHLFWRIGAVAFAGVGGTAPGLDHLEDTKFLPAAGFGLRFMPSPRAGVNVRLDYAIGRNSHALYFSVGEAF